MSTVVFHLKTAAPGHWYPAITLARQLRARGHRVTFVGVADEVDLAPAGFQFRTILERTIPKGTFAALTARAKSAPLASHFAYLRLLHESVDCYARGDVERTLYDLGADLVIADVHMQPTLLSAHGAKIPYLGFATDLTAPRVRGIPPTGSSIIPDGRRRTRALIELSWLAHLASSRALSWTGCHGWPTSAVRRLARRARFPVSEIDQLALYPSLSVPTIVACPAEFDFPDVRPSRRHWVDALVDEDREEPAELTQEAWFRGNAPLVYCSLGSNSHLYRERGRLFRAVVEVMRARPELECFLHVGSDGGPELGPLPANVHKARWAPQLRILRRANLVISHGGLGSIKEAILFGKPMIVVPQYYDQPSNAARIVHHELGVALNPRAVTARALSGAVDLLLVSERHAVRRGAMQQAFRRAAEAQLAADAVEAVLGRRSTREATAASAQISKSGNNGAVRVAANR